MQRRRPEASCAEGGIARGARRARGGRGGARGREGARGRGLGRAVVWCRGATAGRRKGSNCEIAGGRNRHGEDAGRPDVGRDAPPSRRALENGQAQGRGGARAQGRDRRARGSGRRGRGRGGCPRRGRITRDGGDAPRRGGTGPRRAEGGRGGQKTARRGSPARRGRGPGQGRGPGAGRRRGRGTGRGRGPGAVGHAAYKPRSAAASPRSRRPSGAKLS